MIAHKTLKTILLVSISLLMLISTSPATSVAAPTCPQIDIRKQAEGPDLRVYAYRSDVPYEIVVTNTGAVELSNVAVSDSLVSSCARQIGTMAVGEIYTYTCEMPDVEQGFTNIAVVRGEALGKTVTDEDPSSVEIKPPPYYLTIGYEDLLFVEKSDFDYNDWIVSMPIDLQGVYLADDRIELQKITFTMKPQARGAELTQEFHLRFDPGTFSSDGIAELTIYNTDDAPIKPSEQMAFVATETNDYLINFDITGEHTCTCEAFGDHDDSRVPLHNFRRTVETATGFNVPARRYAVLTLVFNTPVLFNLPDYGQHCQGLFFDPYLRVRGYTVSIKSGDPERRILCVRDSEWLWPEEQIRIDLAYIDVNWLGAEPFFEFPAGWYDHPDRITACVFEDAPAKCLESNKLYLPLVTSTQP